MYRTFVIVRHTFVEAIVQPIYSLLLGLGAAVLVIFAALPFFTLGEDAIMFKSVGLNVILIVALIVTLFATSRSIFEEIEDRTMLTLMSKPVKRWQVLAGKYVGIILAAALAVGVLGGVLALCLWWRIPGDYMIRTTSIDDRELRQLAGLRLMHLSGLAPALLQVWLEISALAAVGVALSTRVSLVVNLPVVILIYIAGNLTRFLYGPESPLIGRPPIVKAFAWLISLLLPYLEAFDLQALTVNTPIKIAQFSRDPNAVALSKVWGYVAISGGYAIAYAVFALSVGMWLFQTRELGGAEG